MLVENGADVQIPDWEGKTPIELCEDPDLIDRMCLGCWPAGCCGAG